MFEHHVQVRNGEVLNLTGQSFQAVPQALFLGSGKMKLMNIEFDFELTFRGCFHDEILRSKSMCLRQGQGQKACRCPKCRLRTLRACVPLTTLFQQSNDQPWREICVDVSRD